MSGATSEHEPTTRGSRCIYSAFVDRPVLTLMVTLAVLVVGVISFAKLPLRFAPDGLAENQVNVWVPVRQGMSPREVEEKIVKPFEELLRTIPGIRRIASSSSNGSGRLWIQLDEGMDPTLASAEVRDRAQRAMLQWPEDIDRYFTWREDAASVPLAFFQMLTPERGSEWDYLIDKVVQPRLEAVDGVGRVEVWGQQSESIRIWIDREKLVAHRVSFRDLIRRLASDNFKEPVGEIDNGSERYLVRVDAKFRSLSEIESYPVQPGLVLKDVARIRRVPSVRNSLSRYEQKYTYTGMVRAAAGANPVDSSKRLRAAMDGLRADPRLKDLDFRFLFDQGAMIEESLATLLTTSLQGGVLALIALFVFLRNFRFTIAIALAIPLALLMTGAWLFFAGDTLNLLTMAGMTLAVGMVVDNSVVVLENIRHLRAEGREMRDAAVQGAREVGLAVAMATLTTVVVILPMVFIGNNQVRITLGAVGITLSVALVGSLVVALLLLPSGLFWLGGKARLTGPSLAGDGRYARYSPLTWLLRFNHALLRVSLRNRLVAILIAGVLLYTGQIPSEKMEFSGGGNSPFRRGDVRISMDLPRGLDLRGVEREVIRYENHVLAGKEKWRVESVSSRFSRRDIMIDVKLVDGVDADETKRLRREIEKAWPRRPGVKVRLTESGGEMGGSRSEEKQEDNFVVRLYGRDSDYLMQLAESVRADLEALDEVAMAEIPQLDDNQEVVVGFDRDRLQELGVQPAVVHAITASGLQGRMLTEFEENGRETRLIAEFDSDRNPTLLDLRELKVFSDSGAMQRLGDVADITYEKAVSSIRRNDGKSNVTIVGRREKDVGPLAFRRKLHAVMQMHPLPRGYSWSEDSVYRDSQAQMDELKGAMMLGIVLVFLLMGVLFESVILPLSILFTVPFALFGAMWSLFLFYGSLDPMAFVGMILLCGIVVNNGIVLLDCIHRLRLSGMPRDQAVLEGTRRRLRPIAMTATTTIVGLLPMALFGESSGQGLSYVSMSICVAGGLAMCTVFTAFVVPLMYTLMDDLTTWWWRDVWRRAVPQET